MCEAVLHPRLLMGSPCLLLAPTALLYQHRVEASSSHCPPAAAAALLYQKPTAPWWADSGPQEPPAQQLSPSPTAQPSSASPRRQRHSPADPSAALTSTLAHAYPDPQQRRGGLSAAAAGLFAALWVPSWTG